MISELTLYMIIALVWPFFAIWCAHSAENPRIGEREREVAWARMMGLEPPPRRKGLWWRRNRQPARIAALAEVQMFEPRCNDISPDGMLLCSSELGHGGWHNHHGPVSWYFDDWAEDTHRRTTKNSKMPIRW